MALADVKIVLVEPAGPLNVGSVARVMKNMGLHQLVLVNPQCDCFSSEARQMAVHAIDVLEAAQIVPTLPDALHGCQRAIATTGRRHTTLNLPLEPPSSALSWLITASSVPAALLFGREDRGLTNEELNYAQRLVYIPTSPDYTSLNLAQAVAICCYELHLSATRENLTETDRTITGKTIVPSASLVPSTTDLASLDVLEGFYQHLESLLLTIGYLYPHTVASRMEKFRQLLNRAYPSPTEMALLRGILSQVEWAIRKSESRKKDEEQRYQDK
jgi:tRNA/rRNA methyltransferase